MSTPPPISRAWRRDHPLPSPDAGPTKAGRGQVLLVGGSERVSGALRLTGEAVLRAGAGRLRLGTVQAAAIPLGITMPEVGVVALPAGPEGEIASEGAEALKASIDRCKVLLLGPAMGASDDAAELVRRILAMAPSQAVLLDAGALTCARTLEREIAGREGATLFTPHHGEMARLTGRDEEEIAADPVAIAQDVAGRFRATVVLKADRTVIASPQGDLLLHTSDCPGLAIPGSGDVLSGIIGGFLSRGAEPFAAAAWGVWLHEATGAAAAAEFGPVGFLSRDLLSHIPRLLAAHAI